jgi:hypothetical protein
MILSWQPTDIDGSHGMTGIMAVTGGYRFNISGPWAHLAGHWIMAISRLSDPDDRTGLPDAHKFVDRYGAQLAAERCAAILLDGLHRGDTPA